MKKDFLQPLIQYKARSLPMTPQSAAVMIIILEHQDDELEIVLTKRSANLPTYSNHYSFPGGMHDDTDQDLYATAVRETEEELNIAALAYQYITQLDDFQDRYGHLVRPFVVIMQKDDFLRMVKPSEDEIAAVYYFPFCSLDKIQDNPELHVITRRQPSYSFLDGEEFIWGLTAGILVHFSNVLFGTDKPLGRTIA